MVLLGGGGGGGDNLGLLAVKQVAAIGKSVTIIELK